MDMLTLSHVSKRFGANQVIDDLNFKVPAHSIYGFIGQNGAGKTTTMKMILGLLKADSGDILVNGEKVCYGQNRTNRYIGYLPDVPEFYSYMTPMEYLALCGEITGMQKTLIRKRSMELLELVGLEKSDKRIQGFSRGMKQRLGIAQALLNSPKLLICDEPTSALDPLGRKEILDILLVVREHTTVVFSTHILSDVEKTCDEIGLLHEGKVALQGTIEEIRQIRKSDGFEVEFRNPADSEKALRLWAGGERKGKNLIFFAKQDEKDMASAMQGMSKSGIYPLRMEMREPTLEALFMEVVGR